MQGILSCQKQRAAGRGQSHTKEKKFPSIPPRPFTSPSLPPSLLFLPSTTSSHPAQHPALPITHLPPSPFLSTSSVHTTFTMAEEVSQTRALCACALPCRILPLCCLRFALCLVTGITPHCVLLPHDHHRRKEKKDQSQSQNPPRVSPDRIPKSRKSASAAHGLGWRRGGISGKLRLGGPSTLILRVHAQVASLAVRGTPGRYSRL